MLVLALVQALLANHKKMCFTKLEELLTGVSLLDSSQSNAIPALRNDSPPI